MIIIAEKNRHDSDMVELYNVKGSYRTYKYMIGAIHIDHFLELKDFNNLFDAGPVELEITMVDDDA